MATYTINIDPQVNSTFNFSINNFGTSSNFFMYFNTSLDVDVDWGDGTIDSFTNVSTINNAHTYANAYNGDISVSLTGPLTSIIEFGSNASGARSDWNLNILQPLTNLERIAFGSNFGDNITGNVNDLTNPNLTNITLRGNGNITGSINNITNVNNIVNIQLGGNNTVSGTLAPLTSATSIILTGQNTISGNINLLNSICNNLIIEGQNTISGNISNIPNSISTSCIITGQNTLTGDIANIGKQTGVLTVLEIGGNNTISGSLPNIPVIPSRDLIILGNNTLTGDISSLPSYSQHWEIRGNNTLSGNVNNIIPNLTTSYSNRQFVITGNNAMTGVFDNLDLYRVIDISSNTNTVFTGDINLINVDQSLFFTAELCSSLTYGATSNWSVSNSNIISFVIAVNSSVDALSDAEVDQFLIDLDSYSFNKSFSNISLTGGFSRTSSSDTAFNNLIAAGVDITIT